MSSTVTDLGGTRAESVDLGGLEVTSTTPVVAGPPGPAGSGEGGDAGALTVHINAAEPHPAYDDMQDLAALWQNRIT